jgi:16S rRNA processing protein RimM
MAADDRQDDGELVLVAEVVKAVGLKGEIKLLPLVDWHEPLLGTDWLVWEDGTPLRVLRARPSGSCVVVLSADCRDRDRAEAAVGRRIGFRRDDYLAPGFPRPAAGLPFRFVGREVVLAGSGEAVGVVDEVRTGAAQMLLVIRRGAAEILIPAVAPILQGDDGLSGPLQIDPPEGLLDVAGD